MLPRPVNELPWVSTPSMRCPHIISLSTREWDGQIRGKALGGLKWLNFCQLAPAHVNYSYFYYSCDSNKLICYQVYHSSQTLTFLFNFGSHSWQLLLLIIIIIIILIWKVYFFLFLLVTWSSLVRSLDLYSTHSMFIRSFIRYLLDFYALCSMQHTVKNLNVNQKLKYIIWTKII